MIVKLVRDSIAFCTLALVATSSVVVLADVDSWEDAPVLITPTRMSTPLFDSPSSVTRLPGRMLTQLGITKVHDAMRLVPGMILDEQYAGLIRVGYHRQSGFFPRHMEVLNDSLPIQRSGFGGVSFGQMPTFIEELETIEVVRGTSTVDYGANAFSSAINLLSYDADKMPRFEGSIVGSNADNKKLSFRVSERLGNQQVILRYNNFTTDGFDHFDDKEFKDDLNMESLSFKVMVDLDLDTSIWGSALASNTRYFNPSTELDAFGVTIVNAVGDDRIDSQIVGAGFSRHILQGEIDQLLKLSASYGRYEREEETRACSPALSLDPDLRALDASPNIRLAVSDIPGGISSSVLFGRVDLNESIIKPLSQNDRDLMLTLGQRIQSLGVGEVLRSICGRMSWKFNERRYHFDATHTFSYKDVFNMSSSIGFFRDEVEGEWYRTTDLEALQISNSSRWNLSENWAINLGIMSKVPDIDDDKTYVSSRASVNFHPTEKNAYRLLYGRSKREADIYSISRYLSIDVDYDEGVTDYLGRDQGFVVWISDAPDDLKAEELEVFELAYTYVSRKNALLFDFKLFREQMSNLISEPYTFTEDYFWVVDERSEYQGAELEYRKRVGATLYGFVYTYMSSDSNQPEGKNLYFRHSSAIYGVFELMPDVSLGLAYYGNAGGSGNGNAYDRFDATLSYDKSLSQSTSFYCQLNLRRYPRRQAGLSNPDIALDAGYDSREQLTGTFGFRL